ncbi:hypothetical protein FQZ97_1103500 [compost metagenome]
MCIRHPSPLRGELGAEFVARGICIFVLATFVVIGGIQLSAFFCQPRNLRILRRHVLAVLDEVFALLLGKVLPVIDRRPRRRNHDRTDRDPFRHWQCVQFSGVALGVFPTECGVQVIRALGVNRPQFFAHDCFSFCRS